MTQGVKWTEERIIEQLASLNKVYIAEIERVKGRRRIKHVCSCGRVIESDMRHCINQEGCMACLSERQRKPFDDVVTAFKNIGLQLLSAECDYTNANSELDCRCTACGWQGTTRYGYVQQGDRPCKCPDIEMSEQRKGENNPFYGAVGPNRGKTGSDHPAWKPDRNPRERELERDGIEYEQWRTAVLSRDNFTCQCCGKRGIELRVHHLFPYSLHKSLRYVVDNGIVLCTDCHDQYTEQGFHKIWGTRNNTPFQFWAYVDWRREQLGIYDVNDVKEVTYGGEKAVG